jgi:hypothetical protein
VNLLMCDGGGTLHFVQATVSRNLESLNIQIASRYRQHLLLPMLLLGKIYCPGVNGFRAKFNLRTWVA